MRDLTEIGPGWHDLVRPLLERCATENVQIYQIKQKFGGLRFYANTRGHDGLLNDILRAEAASFSICEECGQPGSLRDEPYIRTLCERHHERPED